MTGHATAERTPMDIYIDHLLDCWAHGGECTDTNRCNSAERLWDEATA